MGTTLFDENAANIRQQFSGNRQNSHPRNESQFLIETSPTKWHITEFNYLFNYFPLILTSSLF